MAFGTADRAQSCTARMPGFSRYRHKLMVKEAFTIAVKHSAGMCQNPRPASRFAAAGLRRRLRGRTAHWRSACRRPASIWAFGLLLASACGPAAQAQAPDGPPQQPLNISPPVSSGPSGPRGASGSGSNTSTPARELERLRAEQRKAQESQSRLTGEIEAIGQDRRKLSTALVESAARVRSVETRIAASETRVRELDEKENSIRGSLQARRAVIGELLAALQRIGRHAPPAMLVRPEEALEAVRTAILLGAVLPEMRQEAEKLAADLADLVRIRREVAAERETLEADLASLSEERQRTAGLIDERQKRQSEAEKALEGERQRAASLARQADTLKELVARLEQDAARPPAAAAGQPPQASPRLGPAIAFASAKGVLPLPVNGVKLRAFGANDGVGGSQKGLSIGARPGAQVTAPCDGWVVYAGPFRSYGQLLILNAGGGYHVLLAGMERISVDLGQFVLTGEPVAAMGGAPRTAAAGNLIGTMIGGITGNSASGATQPVLYIEFRKDGTPVDPGPWWATTDSEKVRG